MTTEQVGFYYLYNGTAGTYIWPQLRSGTDEGQIIWDGRNHDGFGLNIGQGVTVNLQGTNIGAGRLFYIACNTKWGNDKSTSSQQFQYTPGSNRIACGRAYGGARDGGIEYTGVKTQAQLLAEHPDAIIVPIGPTGDELATRYEPASLRGTEDVTTSEDVKAQEHNPEDPGQQLVGIAA